MDGSGDGILALGRDAAGGYAPLARQPRSLRPRFLVLTRPGPVLYAVSEGAALVHAYRFDDAGEHQARSVEPGTASALVCHVAVAPDGTFLVVSCWGDGSVLLFELEADGSLGRRHAAPASEDPYGEDRQSRAHSCLMLGGGRFVTAEMGHDLLRCWSFGADWRARVPWQRDVGARMRPAALRAELGRRRLRQHRVQRRGRDAHRTVRPGRHIGPLARASRQLPGVGEPAHAPATRPPRSASTVPSSTSTSESAAPT